MLTRIAPTPSGYLHIGNVLSFVLTAAVAQQAGARILLRIDDMDRERVNPLYVQDVFDTLHFLEIPWHVGPRSVQEFEAEWSQRHRLPLYERALRQLQTEGKVFACSCSRAQIRSNSGNDIYPGTCCQQNIPLNAPHTSWRLLTDDRQLLNVPAYPDSAMQALLPADMQYFVVRKKDGFPAYQLSSVIDDLHFGVNLIVRGQDLWSSTLAQQELAAALKVEAFQQIRFYHHDLLLGADGIKLSKSAGATSVKYLREQGKTPADVYSEIALLTGHPERVKTWQQLAALLLPGFA
ncbi:tRNA glutamyl-Q(34) synthetase GluQRS [Mucilaginibacter koreensis]